MVLKELVRASLGCFNFEAYHASLLLALCAVDATAKKRFPSENSVGRRFKRFLASNMQLLCGAQNYSVGVEMPEDQSGLNRDEHGVPILPDVGDDFYATNGPRLVRMEGVLYHAFRCQLSHEAHLPDVEFLPHKPGVTLSVKVDTKVRISVDIIQRLLAVVINSPENAEIFGSCARDE